MPTVTNPIISCVIFFYVFAFQAFASDVPSQLHLALAGRNAEGLSDSMTVSWSTLNQTLTSTVKYGLSSGKYDFEATGSQLSYWETFHHHVVLPSALIPATDYFYICGDEVSGFSEERSFHSAPSHSIPEDSFSFAVFADLGIVNGASSINYVDGLVQKKQVDLVWQGGDVGYADDAWLHIDCVTDFCYEEEYDKFMNAIDSWTSKVPYMVLPGNHEADCHDPACLVDRNKRDQMSNFTTFNTRFRMPAPECDAAAENMHYSFNYRNVHFISIDTETGFPGAPEETRYVLPCGGFADQLTWLENDLIQANKERDQRPWIFAQGHHPMYQGGGINAEFQAAMEELFFKYGVDMYFSGHVHSYERDYPVYQGIADNTGEAAYSSPRATTYVMIGGAGNDEMETDKAYVKNTLAAGRKAQDPSPNDKTGVKATGWSTWRESGTDGDWTAFVDKGFFGVGKVDIIDGNTLKFDYIRTTAGEVTDSFVLSRSSANRGQVPS